MEVLQGLVRLFPRAEGSFHFAWARAAATGPRPMGLHCETSIVHDLTTHVPARHRTVLGIEAGRTPKGTRASASGHGMQQTPERDLCRLPEAP